MWFITGNVLDGSVLIVNTDLIGDIEINGYKDLLNPELKGRIATANPANSSSARAQRRRFQQGTETLFSSGHRDAGLHRINLFIII